VSTALPSRPAPLILAAPSGTGKTTIAHALVDQFDHFVFSVSVTTRPQRGDEQDGVDYEFVSEDVFRRMIEVGDLVEWAKVHGNFYGTPRRNLEAARDRGLHPVLDIDVQGAMQIRERIPEAVLVFIFPPGAADLRVRLTSRGTERPEEVRRRLAAAGKELASSGAFDYIVVNEQLDQAVDRVRQIVETEGHRPVRTLDLGAEVSRIREEIDAVVGDLDGDARASGMDPVGVRLSKEDGT